MLVLSRATACNVTSIILCKFHKSTSHRECCHRVTLVYCTENQFIYDEVILNGLIETSLQSRVKVVTGHSSKKPGPYHFILETNLVRRTSHRKLTQKLEDHETDWN